LTAESETLQCPSRNESGFAEKTANWFFQLLGLQIELNLVPTMNERCEAQNLASASDWVFYCPEAGKRSQKIFESLILEFVTRLRVRG
jgi:hypothetical protein